MTLTQIHHLSRAIDRRNTTRWHAEASLHAALHGAKIRGLDEMLGVNSFGGTAFDKQTDDALTRHALTRIESARRHGNRI